MDASEPSSAQIPGASWLRVGVRQARRAVRRAGVLARAISRNSAGVWFWGLVIGVLAGYATLAFRIAILSVQFLAFGVFDERLASAVAEMEPLRAAAPPILGGLVVAGLLWLGARWRTLPDARVLGVAEVIEARAVREGRISVSAGVYSAAVNAAALGSGASTGREGPAVHLGASIASWLAQKVGLPAREARTLLACGAAAAVAASFNAPLAGVLFALEVVLGHYALRVIAPVAVASTAGAVVARAHLGSEPAFALPTIAPASLVDFPAAALFGVAAAGIAIALMRASLLAGRHAPKLATRMAMPVWALPTLAGLFMACVAVTVPQALGVGYEATAGALAGTYGLTTLLVILVVKMAATAVCLGCRYGGGIFSPSVMIGAVAGSAYGALAVALLGEQTAGGAFFALVGMGAVAGAVLGAPLSTTLIVFELTRSYETTIAVLIAVSLATVIVQRVMGAGIFQLQIQARGYDLRSGPQRIILATTRVRDFMTPIDRMKKESVLEGPTLYEDDTLGKALGFLEAEDVDGAPVKARGGDEPVVGYISREDALIAYNRRLVEAHEEQAR